jgi:microcystin-dependent protein
MHPGQGPGLSLHDLGETGGSDTVTLLESETPAHSHGLMAQANIATSQTPTPNVGLARSRTVSVYVAGSPPPPLVQMADAVVAPAGGDQPHNNMQPYLTLNFCIALQGVYPPRT